MSHKQAPSSTLGILEDCPFAARIMRLPQPQRLLLLGSGTTLAPRDWLETPGLATIRFNDKTLRHAYYGNVPTFAVVCWTQTLQACQAAFDGASERPYFLVIDKVDDRRDDVANRVLYLEDDVRWDPRVIGEWYAKVTRTLTKNNGVRKVYTTGFYATLWLLAGPQKQLFVAGFDGYRRSPRMSHLNSEFPDVGSDNSCHDYNGEWDFIEEAVRVARDRGVQVHLATDETHST